MPSFMDKDGLAKEGPRYGTLEALDRLLGSEVVQSCDGRMASPVKMTAP